MIVIFDTGIWVSAFQFGGTPLAALRRAYLSDRIAYCDQIVTEIRAVLVRKFSWQDEDVLSLLDDYLSASVKVEIDRSLHGVCRDPKDDMVFECAESAEARIIISGDRDLLAVGKYRNIS